MMEETKMLIVLERIFWLTERNRYVEARRLVEQELNNLKGITELNCKAKKINSGHCKICKNLNCNENNKK